VPNGLPVNTGRLHRNVRTLVLSEPYRQTDQVGRCRREGANLLHDLAIHYDPKARRYRLLMHIESTTPGVYDFHLLPPDASPAWGLSKYVLYGSCSGANVRPVATG
jgi:hypothetical protein